MKAQEILSTIKAYRDEYRRLDLSNKSASLSFYTVISIFPLMLLLITVTGFLLPGSTVGLEIQRLVQDFYPLQSATIFKNLESLFAKRRTFGWFGGIGLLFSSRLLYLNLEKSVNDLLQTNQKRHFLLRRLFFLAWLLGVLGVVLTPLFLGAIKKGLAYFNVILPTASSSPRGFFLLAAFLMFFLVVAMMPTQRIRLSRIAWGGLLFALALQLGKLVFRWFAVRNLVRYNLIYGSLASIVLAALWIFYFYHMFLFFIYWTGRSLKKE